MRSRREVKPSADVAPGRTNPVVKASLVKPALRPLAFLTEILCFIQVLLVLPPKDVVLYLLEQRCDDTQSHINLVVCGDSILHGNDHSAEELRLIKKV